MSDEKADLLAGNAPAFMILSWGLVSATVCTSLSVEEATKRLNAELPTGISSRWSIAEELGAEASTPCAVVPDQRTHLLFTC